MGNNNKTSSVFVYKCISVTEKRPSMERNEEIKETVNYTSGPDRDRSQRVRAPPDGVPRIL